LATNSTSLNNAPQAGDDLYGSATTGLTEDSLFITYLAVMANDLGGAAKSLYSLDDGTNVVGTTSATDLLTQDVARTEALSTDRSANGARIWITTDGKVGYDAGTLSGDFQARLQQLAAGEVLTDTFTYAIRLGNGTLSWATATIQIAGVNDAPRVTGAVNGTALEDGASVALDALAHASDVDNGATLSVTQVPATLPPGVTFDALTHTFSLDPAHPAFQHLAAGAHTTVTVEYGVTDGIVVTPASVSWSIAGTNDAPVVTGAVTGTASEDGPGATVNALANASDADDGATLAVTGLPATLPPGVSYDALTHSFTLDPTNDAFQHLAAGDHTTVTVNYGITDGTATTAASVTWNVAGTNDAPVIESNGGGAQATVNVDENTTSVTRVTASDVDDGAQQTYSIVGGADADRFTIDATTGQLSFVSAPNREAPDDSDADSLYDVTVRVSDGMSFDDQSIVVSVDDVNEFAVTTPVDADAAMDRVAENAAIGTAVGITAQASDADATTNTVSYSLSDDAGGRFAIDSATGVVTVAGAIDRETDSSLSITVRATSADGSSKEQAYTLAIDDVNEFAVTTPVDADAAMDRVAENAAIGTAVGITAQAGDADATTNTVSYSLSDDAGGRFAIDSATGVVTVAGAIDRETDSSLSITVRATSADGSSKEQAYAVAIDDVNDNAPEFSSGPQASVAENTSVSQVVYDAQAVDADATPAHHAITYSLTGTDAGRFSIDSATGEVRFLASPDYETPTDADGDRAYQIVVHANDDVHDTTQAVTINVTDVVENLAPTDLSLVVTNAPGNNNLPAANTVLGTVLASDPDAGDTFTFSLLAGSSSGFSVNAATGALTTTAAMAENRTYILDVEARDAAGATYHEVFNIITGSNSADNPLPSDGSILTGEDVLYGSGGNDVILGGSGNDWIFGQNGTDRLIGGAGNDVLIGGNNADTFVFLASDGGGTDTVQGFVASGGNNDVLDISNLLIDYNPQNVSSFVQLVQAGGSTTLRVDRDGAGSGYTFEDIAVLQGVTGLNLGLLLSNDVIVDTP
jgi:VCBS repeat-containing protein